MGVGRADEPELEGIEADLALELESALERVADEPAFARAAGDLTGLAGREDVLEAALLVGGAEAERALGVALVLRYLDQRLELGPPLPVLGEIGAAVVVGVGEHEPPRVVAVVGDRQRPARLPAGVVEPVPEVGLGVAVPDPHRVLGHRGAAEDHVAMEHAAVDQGRRVLEADERGELAGLVELLGDLLDLLPRALRRLLAVDALPVADLEARRRALRQPDERLTEDLHVAVADAFAERRRVLRVPLLVDAEREDLETFGVIGDRREVERGAQLLTGAAVQRDGLAARELVGVTGREPVAEDVAVDRIRGVHVEVAEVGVTLGVARNRRSVGVASAVDGRFFGRLLLGAAGERETPRPTTGCIG